MLRRFSTATLVAVKEREMEREGSSDLTNGRHRVDGTVRGTVRRRPTLPGSRSGPANVPVSSTLPSVKPCRRARIMLKFSNRRIRSPSSTSPLPPGTYAPSKHNCSIPFAFSSHSSSLLYPFFFLALPLASTLLLFLLPSCAELITKFRSGCICVRVHSNWFPFNTLRAPGKLLR